MRIWCVGFRDYFQNKEASKPETRDVGISGLAFGIG